MPPQASMKWQAASGNTLYAQADRWHGYLIPRAIAARPTCTLPQEKVQAIVLQRNQSDARILRSAGKALIGKDSPAYLTRSQQSYPQIFWISRESDGKSATWRCSRGNGKTVTGAGLPQRPVRPASQPAAQRRRARSTLVTTIRTNSASARPLPALATWRSASSPSGRLAPSRPAPRRSSKEPCNNSSGS